MPAGDLGTLVKEIQLAKAQFGLPPGAPVRSGYKPGRDGFWLHRWLLAHDVEHVVDASSNRGQIVGRVSLLPQTAFDQYGVRDLHRGDPA
jgi:hypothetical protein